MAVADLLGPEAERVSVERKDDAGIGVTRQGGDRLSKCLARACQYRIIFRWPH